MRHSVNQKPQVRSPAAWHKKTAGRDAPAVIGQPKRLKSLLQFTHWRRAQNSCGGFSAGFHGTCLLSRKNLIAQVYHLSLAESSKFWTVVTSRSAMAIGSTNVWKCPTSISYTGQPAPFAWIASHS